MFLAFFPTALILLGIVATSEELRGGLLDTVGHLRAVLPPGLVQMLAEVLGRHDAHAWRWILLGFGGMLLAGTQMMRLVIDGFQIVHKDRQGPRFWSRNLRALLLLVTTVVPWLVTANLIVFGRQMRNWMIQRWGWPTLVGALWSALYLAVALGTAMVVLAVIYRVGRPGIGGWKGVVPGAAVATLLWWIVSSAFGFYMRHMPYLAIYGGLAVAIGLMLWMQLTATIILIGAAYNAECAGSA